MGWGEANIRSAGTSQEIENAHTKLDQIGVPSGSLGVRVIHLVEGVLEIREASRVVKELMNDRTKGTPT